MSQCFFHNNCWGLKNCCYLCRQSNVSSYPPSAFARHTRKMTDTLLLFFVYSQNVHEVAIPIALNFHFYSVAIVNNLVNFKESVWMIDTFLIRVYKICFFYELVSFLCVFKFKRIHRAILILDCYLYCEAETFQAIHNQVNHNINMSKNNLTVKIQPFHITYIIKYIV